MKYILFNSLLLFYACAHSPTSVSTQASSIRDYFYNNFSLELSDPLINIDFNSVAEKKYFEISAREYFIEDFDESYTYDDWHILGYNLGMQGYFFSLTKSVNIKEHDLPKLYNFIVGQNIARSNLMSGRELK
ncbi:MAG: hypothetical protein JJU05_19430 [Verrucomicrobia bacterium]|nr:hypothetical protein [Verrucomicrobiota bacterium]